MTGIKNKKYYVLAVEDKEASIFIFGDIVSWEWFESDVSSYTLAKEIEGLDVDTINVFINSYGGEVAEGLAIYNQLRRHKAKVKTYCDGFACSAASVVFMAGDERIMSHASLLMIHNAWFYTAGDANQLRKDADDLDTITQASMNAYLAHVNIPEAELKALMDATTWISPENALAWGFATAIDGSTSGSKASQSYRGRLMQMVLLQQQAGKLQPVLDAGEIMEKLSALESRVGELSAQLTKPVQEDKPKKHLLAAFAKKGS